MKTKLVYVLTCAPEATYIEQALMAVWSARYWNPDAHIVLMVDDKTDELMTGKRREILNYISEKICVPFEDESLSPMYRSRWIKTTVRQLIKGDFLFVDCDTICCRSLVKVDDFTCEVGAVGDNNTTFQEDIYKEGTIENVLRVGCDISNEEYYYSSGVVYSKDTENAHQLYELWHKFWIEGTKVGVNIDQPALAKANIERNHIIKPIDDVFNCVLYTQIPQSYSAAILHIPNLKPASFLFKKHMLRIVREQGITSWVSQMIVYVHGTYLPFDYSIRYSSFRQRLHWICLNAKVLYLYGQHVSSTFEDLALRVSIEPLVVFLIKLRCYRTSMVLWMMWKRLKLSRKHLIHPNVCSNKCYAK